MRLLLVFLFLVLQGCMSTDVASKGATFTYEASPKSGKAIAYFYQFALPGVNSCLLVGVDGKYKACMGYPGYAKVSISAGDRDISFTPNSLVKISNLNFKYKFMAGREYFFCFQPVFSAGKDDIEIASQYNVAVDKTYGWFLVDKNKALEEMRKLRLWQ
ncbi:hypothetical protein [Gallaecimonas mangrovi]|uniref:hypothetical protein n=1 Tax=Gallaecimonas mangrovi TaxID=2291597 RepID=UPI000E20079A|nr:hypothetical protein [Gallaecimonas mangrovi]